MYLPGSKSYLNKVSFKYNFNFAGKESKTVIEHCELCCIFNAKKWRHVKPASYREIKPDMCE